MQSNPKVCTAKRSTLVSSLPGVMLLTADDIHDRNGSCSVTSPEKIPHHIQCAAGGTRFRDFHRKGTKYSPLSAAVLTGRSPSREPDLTAARQPWKQMTTLTTNQSPQE